MALPLTPAELSFLRVVHESDRDHGGLASEEMNEDEIETCMKLESRGLVELVSEFGEAPDGEEDERDAGGRYCVRITGRGVESVSDAND